MQHSKYLGCHTKTLHNALLRLHHAFEHLECCHDKGLQDNFHDSPNDEPLFAGGPINTFTLFPG